MPRDPLAATRLHILRSEVSSYGYATDIFDIDIKFGLHAERRESPSVLSVAQAIWLAP